MDTATLRWNAARGAARARSRRPSSGAPAPVLLPHPPRTGPGDEPATEGPGYQGPPLNTRRRAQPRPDRGGANGYGPLGRNGLGVPQT